MTTSRNPSTISEDSASTELGETLSMYRGQIMTGMDVDSRPLKEAATDQLISEYESKDHEGKLEILAECFYRTDEPSVVEFLIERIKRSEDPQLTALAMIGISRVADDQAVNTILDVLSSPETPELLVPGINTLERMDPGQEAVEILVDLLKHDWDEVKFHASMALSRLSDLSQETLMDELDNLLDNGVSDSTKYYIVLLIKEGGVQKGIPILEELLEDEVIGYFSIEALGDVGGERPMELIAPYLTADDPIRQYYAAEAMGKIGTDEYWDQLVDLAQNHKDRNVRYYAMRALHDIDPDESVETLLKCLKDDDPEIRDYASQALIEFGDVVFKPYREALDSDDREAVKEALHVLGEIGDEDVLGELLNKAYSADKEIEHAALEALQKMAGESERSRKWLLDQLPESKPNLKINILRVLEGLGNSDLCSYLSRYLTADNTKLRYYTVGVCSGQDNPECLHLLGRLCEDDNLQVATYAVRTLTSIQSREARQTAVDLIEKEIRPLVLIAYLRGFYLDRAPVFEDPVAEIIETSDDRRLRYYAASALKAINEHRLERMAQDNEYLQSILDTVRVT